MKKILFSSLFLAAAFTLKLSHQDAGHSIDSKSIGQSVRNDIKGKPDDKEKPAEGKKPDNKKPDDKKPDDKKPEDKKPDDKKPEDKAKPEDKKKPDDKGKPTDAKKPNKPENKDGKVSDPDPGVKSDKVTDYPINCNSKGRCWQWCGDNDKISAAKNDFHKETDGKWCYTSVENSCKTRDDCKNQTKCVDNCEARWGGN